MAQTSQTVWEPPPAVGGAREWRGWRGDFLHATIHHQPHADLPFEACVNYRTIGRYPTVEAAMLAVQRHDAGDT